MYVCMYVCISLSLYIYIYIYIYTHIDILLLIIMIIILTSAINVYRHGRQAAGGSVPATAGRPPPPALTLLVSQ